MGKRREDDSDRNRYEAHAAAGGAFLGIFIGVILLLAIWGLSLIFDFIVPPDVWLILIIAPALIVGVLFGIIQHRTHDNQSDSRKTAKAITPEDLQRRFKKKKKYFTYLDLRGHDLQKKQLRRMSFRGSVLRDQDLAGADLSETDLCGVDLSGANLEDADLTRAVLYEADLRHTNLKNAVLKEVDLQFANLGKADLAYASLWLGNMVGASFDQAVLTDTNLRMANLQEANLRSANLSNANLRGANLAGANLKGAILQWADLRRVMNIVPEQLLQASSLDGATMPDGVTLMGAKGQRGPTLEEWLEKKTADGAN